MSSSTDQSAEHDAETSGAATAIDKERLRAEQAALWLAAVVDSSSDAIVGKKLDGTIISWNEGAQQLFGYTAAEIIGRPAATLIPPDRQHEEREILERIRHGERVEPFETVRVRKDGMEIEISVAISPVKDRDGRVIGASKIARDISERKRMEEALRRSDDRFRGVIESAMDAIITVNAQQTIVMFNATAERMFDCPAKQAIGASIERFLPARFRAALAGHICRFADTVVTSRGMDAMSSLWALRADGTEFPIEASISQVTSGAEKLFSVIVRDVTERKQSEDARQKSLAASEQALKELADQKFALDQHAIVAITDVQGTITYVNDKFCAISQYSREELIGHNHRILNSRHHPREFFQQMYRTIASGKVWHAEIKNRAKDGSFYWVDTTIVPSLNAEGKPRQYVAIRADISGRKRIEDALQESLAASEQAVKELADQKFALDQHAIVAITDVQGTITYVNEKFCAISQYSREELIGHNHRILNSGYHPRKFFQQMYRTIAGGEVWHAEIKNRAKNGSFYWVDTTIVPTLNVSGKPQQYVAIRADISERKRAEVALEKQKEELARSNADLEQFAYAASHDLQEPLRAVSGCMHLLQARYQDKIDERANEYIHHAVDGAGRMQNLIDDLLSFSRVGSRGGEFLPVDCAKAVESALKNLSLAVQETGAQVECDRLPLVSGDLSQLSLLFQNLMGNALKFHGLEAPHIFIGAEQQTTEWLISVRDNGIGIDPQYFERIFVIFQRLHTRKEYPGTGMGLALCRKIVERHGGRIWVESEAGKGTTFRFSLPLPSLRLAPIV